MKLQLLLGLTLGILFGAASSVIAQPGGPGARGGSGMGSKPPGMNPALADVFGKGMTFTAKVQFSSSDASGKETVSGPAEMAFADGNTYWNMDLTELKGPSMPPEAMAQMKTFGLTQMTSISKPDGKSYQVYPALQSYVEMPPAATKNSASPAVVKTEPAGEETVNGYPCKKNKVIVESDGKRQEVLTWNATKLSDFPVRVQFVENGNTIRMDFKDIKREKPEAKLFEPPAGATKYDNVQQMVQAVMMKRFGQPPGQ
jgi:hypothetical protein